MALWKKKVKNNTSNQELARLSPGASLLILPTDKLWTQKEVDYIDPFFHVANLFFSVLNSCLNQFPQNKLPDLNVLVFLTVLIHH